MRNLFILLIALLVGVPAIAQVNLYESHRPLFGKRKWKARTICIDSLKRFKKHKIRVNDTLIADLDELDIYGPEFKVHGFKYKRGKHFSSRYGKKFAAISVSDDNHILGVADNLRLEDTGTAIDTIRPKFEGLEDEMNLPGQTYTTPAPGQPVQFTGQVSCKQVLIYTEVTFPYFRACSTLVGARTVEEGVQATVDRITSIFAVKAGIYLREGIVVKLHSIRVWSTQDPYSTLSTIDVMVANFATNEYQKPLASQYHVGSLIDLGTATRNFGGKAYTDQLNKANGKYNAQCLYTSFQTASYSWTVNCWTHETGHTFGSKHTHWCGWDLPNGTKGRIDSCWSGEGTCGSTTRRNLNGTVMSYCHILGAINFNLGFGPLPGNRIRQGLEASTVPCVGITSPTCTTFTYSPWSNCNNGTQTRTVVSASPSGCINGNPVLSQTCTSLCIDQLQHYINSLGRSAYRFRITQGCTYSVSYSRYDAFLDPNIPPLSGSIPTATGARLTNYTPTASELQSGWIDREANPQPSVRGRWYNVEVVSGGQRVRTFFWWP